MSYIRVITFLIVSSPVIFMLVQAIVKPFYLCYEANKNWLQVPATISKFEVYDGEIELEYFFINKTDTIWGNKLLFGVTSGYGENFIVKLSEKFNNASKINVFFNPQHPAQNVVLRTVQTKTISLVIMFFLTWEFFAFMLCFGFLPNPKLHYQIVEQIIVIR